MIMLKEYAFSTYWKILPRQLRRGLISLEVRRGLTSLELRWGLTSLELGRFAGSIRMLYSFL